MSHADGPYDPDAPERGDALKLALIGLVFAGVGVLLLAVGNPVMGLMGIAFGLMAVIAGIAMAVGPDTPAGRWLVISSSLLFAADAHTRHPSLTHAHSTRR